MAQFKIDFGDGKVAQAEAGETILAAAQRAGVYVNSVCGGDGVCGKCRVRVAAGRASGGTDHGLGAEDIAAGFVLACKATIESDLRVEVPAAGQLDDSTLASQGESRVVSEADEHAQLAPLVWATELTLPQPDLESNFADLQRLEQPLSKALDTQHVDVPLDVLRSLPDVLRQAGWKVAVHTAYNRGRRQIIDIEPSYGDAGLCLAIDIGTTTVHCHLVDLRHGRTIAQAAKYNSQVGHGADVIRRIIYASQGTRQRDEMRELIVGDINELIGELCAEVSADPRRIWFASVAGNTTMIHLLLGLPADNIRKEPYVGAAYRLGPVPARELGIAINPQGLVYCLPAVASFVGGDIIAGILATGMARSEQVRMLIDIGTNGEIAIGNRDFLVCASASAGPAFEGTGCKSGMRATRGAIDHLRMGDARTIAELSTIGGGSPVGLCGTGYIDLVAELLRVGVIDKTGQLHAEAAPDRVRPDASEQLEYVLVRRGEGVSPLRLAGVSPVLHGAARGQDALGTHGQDARATHGQDAHATDIVIASGDIENLLRAKGAIYAAASVLLSALNMRFDELEEVLVAGAFGNYMSLPNAVTIGLLPDLPRERLRFVGNSALAGAKLAALSQAAYEEADEIADRTTYFELSTAPTFMDEFVSACFLPHTNIELFPSVIVGTPGRVANRHAAKAMSTADRQEVADGR